MINSPLERGLGVCLLTSMSDTHPYTPLKMGNVHMIRKFKLNIRFFVLFSFFAVFLLWGIYLIIIFSSIEEGQNIYREQNRVYNENYNDLESCDPLITPSQNIRAKKNVD